MVDQTHTSAAITHARLAAFSQLMREKLDGADAKTRKAYLQSVVSQVDDEKIRVFSDRTTLAAAVIGQNAGTTNVHGFVRNWRAIQEHEMDLTPPPA